MIHAEEVQHGGVQVVHVNGVFHRLVAELVGGAVNRTPFDATTCHPSREAPMVVIASVDFTGVGAWRGQFHSGSAPEFSGPKHKGVI